MKKIFTLVLLLAFALLANMSLVTADMHGWWADAAAPYAGTTIRGVFREHARPRITWLMSWRRNSPS